MVLDADGIMRGPGGFPFRLPSPGKYKQKKPDLQITGHIRREILKEFRTSDVLEDFV